MGTLNSTRVIDVVEALHRDADASDHEHVEAMQARIAARRVDQDFGRGSAFVTWTSTPIERNASADRV